MRRGAKHFWMEIKEKNISHFFLGDFSREKFLMKTLIEKKFSFIFYNGKKLFNSNFIFEKQNSTGPRPIGR